MLERTRAQSPFYTRDHEAFRDVVRRFVAEGDRTLRQPVG